MSKWEVVCLRIQYDIAIEFDAFEEILHAYSLIHT